MPADYSSQAYWEARLAKEQQGGFEWLVPSSSVLPLVDSIVEELSLKTLRKQAIGILHFGCGSSSLGWDVQHFLGSRATVTDADYASNGITSTPSDGSPSPHTAVPLVQLDVLSTESLRDAAPVEGWDLLIDKSTADAISCGEPRFSSSDQSISSEPIDLLCSNLASVTRAGGMWISISYSSSRFDFISELNQQQEWRLIRRLPVKLNDSFVPGSGSAVYKPETGVWAWVLERL